MVQEQTDDVRSNDPLSIELVALSSADNDNVG